MRLRHLNFWTAPLAAVCPKISRALSSLCGLRAHFTFGVRIASAKRKSLALPYMVASRLFYFASQKYPFFGVDIARFFILYLQKIVALPAFIGYRYIL